MTNLALPPLPSMIVDDEALANQITLLAGQINAAEHRLLKMIAEFDRRRAWSGGGTVRSCAHWLNWKCGIAKNAAREKVRVARCLETLPLIDASFAKGEISYSKVRAMTRAATPENEDYLLMIARHGTASHMEQVIRKYKSVQARSDKEREQIEKDRRELVYYQDDDGMWVIHGKLPREEGALLVKAIEARAKPRQEDQQKALQEKKNASAEAPGEVEANTSQRFNMLLSQTRADALAEIAEHFLATHGQGTQHRPQISHRAGSHLPRPAVTGPELSFPRLL